MCFSGLYSSLVLPLFFSAFEDRSRARRKARHSGGSREREREGRKRGKDPSDQKLLLSVRERAPLLSSSPRCFKKKKTPAPFFSFVALFQHCAIYAPIAPFPPSPQPGEGAASISSSQCGRKQRPCDAHEGEPGVAISSFAEGLAFFFFCLGSRSLFLSLFSLKKKREQNLPANTSWANSLGCGPEACSAVADTTLERTLVAPPEGDEELVDDELGADGVVVVVAADDVEAPFLIAADVFRRGAATARATIVPRLAGSGAAALPLVVATVTKQLCELVRAKDAMFQRRRRRREGEKESASCLVFFLLLRRRVEESERERREREREKTRSRSSSTSSFFVATSTTTSSSTPSTADPLNRIPSLSLSLSCVTQSTKHEANLSLKNKNKGGKTRKTP